MSRSRSRSRIGRIDRIGRIGNFLLRIITMPGP